MILYNPYCGSLQVDLQLRILNKLHKSISCFLLNSMLYSLGSVNLNVNLNGKLSSCLERTINYIMPTQFDHVIRSQFLVRNEKN